MKKTDINIIDYLLLTLFVVSIVVIYAGFSYRSDLWIGYVVPISVCIISTLIFLRYIVSIFTFKTRIDEAAKRDTTRS